MCREMLKEFCLLFYLILKKNHILEYNNLLDQEEEFLGDRNTTYFHNSTLAWRRSNKILALKNSVGEWFWDLSDIKNLINKHLVDIFTTSLFTSQCVWTGCPLSFNPLSTLDV